MTGKAEEKRPGEPLGHVGRYELRTALASGGMASVFLAHLQGPHGFEKSVAVKRIHPHLKTDARFVQMFLDEARIAARIHHPNVCTIVDFGEEDGTPYLVMEYLNGEPLSSVMRAAHKQGGPPPVWLGARVVHDAARGLHAAHELTGSDGKPLGIVHRDVSPQNVFVLYDGLTKVVDFGVARARGRLSVTKTNEVKGKLPYMAPEQFGEEQTDRRADVWSLGVLLWEATVGRRLFRGESDAATLASVLQKPIPRPSEIAPEYPPRLEEIVMRALERDVAQRYPTAEALAEDLEELIYAMGKPAGAAHVKKWMHERFAEQIEYRSGLLRGEAPTAPTIDEKISTLSSIRSRPSLATVEDDDEKPTSIASGSSTGGMRAPVAPTAAPSSTPWKAIVAILASGAIIAGAILLAARRDEPRPSVSVAPATMPTSDLLVAPATPPEVAAAPATEESRPPTPASEASASRPRSRRAPRPAAPTQAAAPATSAAPGTLSLMAIPSASVKIDGRERGNTPLINVSLPPGEHRVELRSADGRSRTLTVRIESGRATRQRVEL